MIRNTLLCLSLFCFVCLTCSGGEKEKKAVEGYRKAAEQGDAKAQHDLGWSYSIGKGVDKDLTKAVMWYRKAAEQGFAMAQLDLARCYSGGRGVARDEAQAIQWSRKAAEQGT